LSIGRSLSRSILEINDGLAMFIGMSERVIWEKMRASVQLMMNLEREKSQVKIKKTK
jgi:hypothetical protein